MTSAPSQLAWSIPEIGNDEFHKVLCDKGAKQILGTCQFGRRYGAKVEESEPNGAEKHELRWPFWMALAP